MSINIFKSALEDLRYQSFVKSLSEVHSKQHEEKIISTELVRLQKALAVYGKANDDIQYNKYIKDLLLKALYCIILGYEVNNCKLAAIYLTKSKDIWCKYVGYLLISQVISNTNDNMLYLLVNTIHKNLNDQNLDSVVIALNMSSTIVHANAIPVLFCEIKKYLTSSSFYIRQKAIGAIMNIGIQDKINLYEVLTTIDSMLDCNYNPLITNILYLYIRIYENELKTNSIVFFTMQKRIEVVEYCRDQINFIKDNINSCYENNLPKHIYWKTIAIFRVLAKIIDKAENLSAIILSSLYDFIDINKLNSDLEFCLQYECMITITSIYPSYKLYEFCVGKLNSFFNIDNNNLKMVGLQLLNRFVLLDPTFVNKYKSVILNCLKNNDVNIINLTLTLMSKITNIDNFNAIYTKLFECATTYKEFKNRIIGIICNLFNDCEIDLSDYVDKLHQFIITYYTHIPYNFYTNVAYILVSYIEDKEKIDAAIFKNIVNILLNQLLTLISIENDLNLNFENGLKSLYKINYAKSIYIWIIANVVNIELYTNSLDIYEELISNIISVIKSILEKDFLYQNYSIIEICVISLYSLLSNNNDISDKLHDTMILYKNKPVVCKYSNLYFSLENDKKANIFTNNSIDDDIGIDLTYDLLNHYCESNINNNAIEFNSDIENTELLIDSVNNDFEIIKAGTQFNVDQDITILDVDICENQNELEFEFEFNNKTDKDNKKINYTSYSCNDYNDNKELYNTSDGNANIALNELSSNTCLDDIKKIYDSKQCLNKIGNNTMDNASNDVIENTELNLFAGLANT